MTGAAVVIRGDAARLPLPDESVDLVVTSPPYFALRSYSDGGEHYDGQIGSEATPQAYLEALWACTAEWVRVLRPGGSVFVNIGDKYNSAASGQKGTTSVYNGSDPSTNKWANDYRINQRGGTVPGLAPKSLLGLPWRYALGCVDQASDRYRADYIASLYDDVLSGDISERMFWRKVEEFDAMPKSRGLGLILRAEIIWAKPNGLPESVTDRVRRSHEQVFHFTRQPRYYAAVDEIREPHSGNSHPGRRDGAPPPNGKIDRLVATGDHGGNYGGTNLGMFNPLGKLPGSVWSIPSAPLVVPERVGVDHFAAFPPELVRRIVAGWSPAGVCMACGEGRRPVTDKAKLGGWRVGTTDVRQRGIGDRVGHGGEMVGAFHHRDIRVTITGYACGCAEPDAPARPAVVLDPFGGTGTTALVASVLGRVGVTVDRSGDYCRLAAWRTADPGERARALGVRRPPPVPEGQGSLFDDWEAV